MNVNELYNTGVNLKNSEKEINKMLVELNKYINSTFNSLKTDVINSHLKTSKNKFIETIVVNKENVYKYDGYYFPIKLKDDNENIQLEEVYVDLDIFDFQMIENKKYKCWIEYEGDYIELSIKLKQNSEYLRKISKLKEIFELNSVEWATINLSTVLRMCNIILVNDKTDIEINEWYEIIKQIQNGTIKLNIDFEGYENAIKRNCTVLWNIDEKEIISSMFLRPVKYDISYEHNIICDDDEMILIDNTDDQDILFSYEKNINEITIISKRKDIETWNVYALKNLYYSRSIFEIVEHSKYFSHNLKMESYIDKIKNTYGVQSMSLSKAGINKIFQDYDFIRESISLASITYEFEKNNSIIDEKGEELYVYSIDKLFDYFDNKNKINLSSFLSNNENDEEYNKGGIINLFLKVNEEYKYLVDDISFIVAKIKECMPYYAVKVYKYD